MKGHDIYNFPSNGSETETSESRRGQKVGIIGEAAKRKFLKLFYRKEKRRMEAKKENGFLRTLATFPHLLGGRSTTEDCLSPPVGPPMLGIRA